MKKKQEKTVEEKKEVLVPEVNWQEAVFTVTGLSKYVQLRNSKKDEIMGQMSGKIKKLKGDKKPKRNYKKEYNEALYKTKNGEYGIPVTAFKAALVAATRLVPSVKMTEAKQMVCVVPDGCDETDIDRDLVLFTKGKPQQMSSVVRNANGRIDVRIRGFWAPGWQVKLRIRYDADFLDEQQLTNLLYRAGLQVGVGEGRPSSKSSCGMGWGMFGC